ncbi:MAG TPA: alpha/beta hydrolase [Azospirillaceae bacterium]|nr:alpha/beta hydrolase [Azospirillaceae bacterium]
MGSGWVEPARHGPVGRATPRRAAAGLLLASAAAVGTAAVVVARARRAERRNPPAGRFLTVDGVRLHFVDRGPEAGEEGPPVVLLHGNGAMVADFAISGLIDGAARNHRVLAFDRPGFGHSSRPRDRIWWPEAQAAVIAQALRRLNVHRPVVLGHSWGALVALALALESPSDVAGLVLMSGYYFPTPRVDALLFAPPALPVVGDAMRYTISPVLSALIAPALIRRMFAPKPVTRRFAAEFPVDMSLRPWQLRAFAADSGLMVPAAARLQDRYRKLDTPVAILAGDGDRIVDHQAQAVALSREVPGSTLTILPGLGHMPHHFAASAVLDAIEDVAQRAGPGAEEARTLRNTVRGAAPTAPVLTGSASSVAPRTAPAP